MSKFNRVNMRQTKSPKEQSVSKINKTIAGYEYEIKFYTGKLEDGDMDESTRARFEQAVQTLNKKLESYRAQLA